MELLFHTGESLFYRDGVLQEEPEETLEELLKQYDEDCNAFLEFNGFNGIDMLEFAIDLKIMHINARESLN